MSACVQHLQLRAAQHRDQNLSNDVDTGKCQYPTFEYAGQQRRTGKINGDVQRRYVTIKLWPV